MNKGSTFCWLIISSLFYHSYTEEESRGDIQVDVMKYRRSEQQNFKKAKYRVVDESADTPDLTKLSEYLSLVSKLKHLLSDGD